MLRKTQCITKKRCKGCRRTIPLENFYKCPTGKLGRFARCKGCVLAALAAKRRQAGCKKIRSGADRAPYGSGGAYVAPEPRRVADAERKRARSQARYRRLKESGELSIRWRESDRKRRADPAWRARRAARRAIEHALQRRGVAKTGSTSEMLPWTAAALKAHLEAQFEPWMSWENYGKPDGWHIDHIRPLALFGDLTPGSSEFLEACALSNLRPLAAAANLQKSDKIETEWGRLITIAEYREIQEFFA